jgi:hypothetical protein
LLIYASANYLTINGLAIGISTSLRLKNHGVKGALYRAHTGSPVMVNSFCLVSVQRTHLPLKINFAHDTVFTGAYHDHHTYPRHMATTPSRMAAKPTQQKRLLQKTQPQTYHVLQMGKQTLRQNNTHLT